MFTKNGKENVAINNMDESSAMNSSNITNEAQSYGSADDSNDIGVESPTNDQEDAHHSVLSSSTLSRSSSSLIGPVANLCSATLGAGVLALPYALQQAGLVWGALLLLFAGVSTLYSLDLLVQACRYNQVYTYEGIVQLALGKRARNVCEVSILLFCGGCAVAYIITVGDIVESLFVGRRNVAMLVVWCLSMLPLSLLKRMTSLQSASGVGIFSIFLLIAVANIHYFRDVHNHTQAKLTLSRMLWPENGATSVLKACPLIIFAFSCQPNVCAIYHELEDKQKMKRVLVVAVSVCAMLYTSISLAAYLDFGDMIQPNVLQNFCVKYPMIQVAFVGMTIAVVMAFPLNIFPTRVTLEGLIWGHHHHAHVDTNSEVEMEDTSSALSVQEPLLAESYYNPDSTMHDPNDSECRHVTLTLAITSLALILAMVAPNISVVFGLLGGTTSSVIGFILPGLVGSKVLIQQSSRWKAKLLAISGVVVGILTTIVTIVDTFSNNSDANVPHYYNPCNVTVDSH